jgi:PAS domain S-box-containing protein
MDHASTHVDRWTKYSAFVLCTAVFFVDLSTPLGVTVWMLYLIPLVICSRTVDHVVMMRLMGAIGVLIVLGYLFSTPGVPAWVAVTNRLLGVVLIVTTTLLLLKYRAAEASARDTEARFHQMADTIHEVFWVANTDVTSTTYVSPAYEKIWGRSCESLRENPASWIEGIHPDDRERVLVEIQKYRTGRSDMEYRVVRPDGSVRWVWDHGYPVTNVRGDATSVVGIAIDITARKLAEEENKEQSRLLRTILDSVGDGVIVTDSQGKFVLFNPEAVKQHGGLAAVDIPPDEWAAHYGLYLPDRVTPYPSEALPLTRAMRGESVDNVEVYVRNDRCPDGLWALVSGRPVKDEHGRLWGGVIVRRDITGRKRAEEALQESERRLALVLDATSEGVWDWNVQTGEVNYSRRWIESLGYTQAEVPPHMSFWQSIVHPDDMPHVEEALRAHFDRRTPVSQCENRLRTKSGGWRWNLDRGKVVDWSPDGRPLRMVGTDTDITERKLAEQAREALVRQLQEALANIKTLRGLLPICSSCQRVRDPQGRWNDLESYVRAHSEADIRRDLCADCGEALFPGFYKRWNKSRELPN